MRGRTSTIATIVAAVLLSAPVAVAHEHGKAASSRPARPHMDHTPKHGGIFFMAPDGFHHLEGVYERPGVVRVYMYDDYSTPIRAEGFAGNVALSESTDGDSVRLRESPDGTLVALFPSTGFPVMVDVWLEFPAKNGKPASREVFSFAFEGFSDVPAEKPTKAHFGAH